jgi:hypothetical protein
MWETKFRTRIKQHLIIHSFSSLSYDRSIASSEASSPQSVVYCFFLHVTVPSFSLRLPSSHLHLLPRLPITSVLPSIFPSITCFRRQFVHKMWPIQLAFLLFIVHRIFLSSLTLSKVSKVKCTLVQALRLCTGRTAHRGSRGIALPFHDRGTRRGW